MRTASILRSNRSSASSSSSPSAACCAFAFRSASSTCGPAQRGRLEPTLATAERPNPAEPLLVQLDQALDLLAAVLCELVEQPRVPHVARVHEQLSDQRHHVLCNIAR